MALFQKRIQKRRMSGERIAGFVDIIEFDREPGIWLPQFEAVLHKIMRYEFYLDKIPDNLALPKYRSIVVKIIYRMLQQTPAGLETFSRDIRQPDPRIKLVLDYIRDAELRRKEALYRQYPVTTENIKAILRKLQEEREI